MKGSWSKSRAFALFSGSFYKHLDTKLANSIEKRDYPIKEGAGLLSTRLCTSIGRSVLG